METICVVMEQQGGQLARMSWEALAAAQGIAAGRACAVEAVLIGGHLAELARQAAAGRVSRVWMLEDPQLEAYTPDCFCLALQQFLAAQKPFLAVLPHTYQVRDFGPRLATRMHSSLLSDCIAYRIENNQIVFTRPLFQGKMNADFSFEGEPPWFVSVQAVLSQPMAF